MALCYTRLLCRRNVDLRHFRCLYTSNPLTVAVANPLRAERAVCESHDEKNMRLKRPMSPHLTIYQMQLTAVLSISHRTTGIILWSYGLMLGFGTLLIPGGIPCLIEMTQNLGLYPPLILIGKLLLAFPATYHTANGIRHLAWDLGMFLSIKQVYTTGYIAVAVAALAALGLAAM